jgi:hypothetical protein
MAHFAVLPYIVPANLYFLPHQNIASAGEM